MRSTRKLALGASLLASLAMVGTAGGSAIVSAQDGVTVRVGSDGFYESVLMAEIYAQALEAEGYTVERLLGIGTREARIESFVADQIDIVPEYVGSGLAHYARPEADDPELAALEVTSDGETNRENLQRALDIAGLDATVLAISAGEDTNAAVVRSDTAAEFGLSSMSDLAAVADQLTFGLPPECDGRPLCSDALESYGITWPPANMELLPACDAPMATALEGNAIDVAWLCSTQPQIAKNGWVVLTDDLDTQPAENLAPVVRNEFLAGIDGGADTIAAILDPISAAITTEVLTELDARVAIDQELPGDVAADFLGTLSMDDDMDDDMSDEESSE